MAYKASHIPTFKAIAPKLTKAVREVLREELDAIAEEEREDFVERIEDQRFASFKRVLYPDSPYENRNLSPAWMRRKISHDADQRTMIATGTYVDGIVVRRKLDTGAAGGGTWRIGFNPTKRARNLKGETIDLTLEELAVIHEFGTLQTPARPHWGPQLNRIRQRAPQHRVRIRAAIKARLGKDFKTTLKVA